MDISLHKSAVLGGAVKEESKPSESNGDEESCVEELVLHQVIFSYISEYLDQF